VGSGHGPIASRIGLRCSNNGLALMKAGDKTPAFFFSGFHAQRPGRRQAKPKQQQGDKKKPAEMAG